MMFRKSNVRSVCIALSMSLAVAVLFSGCGNMKRQDKDVVARVNNDVIYRRDLKRDIALRAKYDPQFRDSPVAEAEQLEAMIDRKIMIQAAMEKGLANDERFVSTIRNIWEHTLIRDFIEYQKREFHELLFVTDEEIRNYYNNMRYNVTFKVFKSPNFDDADAAYRGYMKDKDTSGWQTVGPLSYDEIEAVPLYDAFSMSEGEAGKFSDDSSFYVIEIVKKEMVSDIKPLESLREVVEKRVLEIKEKRLFQEWIIERKRNSRIKINL